MRRKENKSDSSGFSGYRFSKANTFGMYPLAKDGASTSDEQVEKLTRKFNIHYRSCIGSLIYLLSTRVDLSFAFPQVSKVFIKAW